MKCYIRYISVLFLCVAAIGLQGCPKKAPAAPAAPAPAAPAPLAGSCAAAGPALASGSCPTACPTGTGCRNCCNNTYGGDRLSNCLDSCAGLTGSLFPSNNPTEVARALPSAVVQILVRKGYGEELVAFIDSLDPHSAMELHIFISTLSSKDVAWFVSNFPLIAQESSNTLLTWAAVWGLDPSLPEDRFTIYRGWIHQILEEESDRSSMSGFSQQLAGK